MTKSKRATVAFILIFAVSVGLFCTVLDFSRFWGAYALYDTFPVHWIKRVNVLLAALLVWAAGRDSYNIKDITRMKRIFLVICLGEAAFLLGRPDIAIGIFAVCQLLLILRNGNGLRYGLKNAAPGQKTKLSLLGLSLLFILYSLVSILKAFAGSCSLQAIAMAYGLLLSISLWIAAANYTLGLFPAENSILIVTGMVCFYLCDIMVGLDGILKPGLPWLIASSMIWVFYTPAVILLALSCYRYD